MALTAAASHKGAAVQLVEFLASPESQQWYAQENGEYPVREGVAVSETLAAWGPFKADTLNLARLGERFPEVRSLSGAALMLSLVLYPTTSRPIASAPTSSVKG